MGGGDRGMYYLDGLADQIARHNVEVGGRVESRAFGNLVAGAVPACMFQI